jgi:hypothetical protein
VANRLLSIVALMIVVASTTVGCGGGGSPCPSTLTILSIATGNVSVMKAGTASWTPAQAETQLKVGDTIKTGEDSDAEITFFDGSTMDMEAGTQIEILSLSIACDTGVTTIGLRQMIGDTITVVTRILDPASSYEVETPSGVVGVRGSSVRIQVFVGNSSYEDGTTLATNLGGHVYTVAQGVEREVGEGEQCIMIPGHYPDLMPVAANDTATTLELHRITIPVLDNDYDPDPTDTLTVSSVTQPVHGSVGNNVSSVTYIPDPDFHGTDRFTYTVSDGRGGTDTAIVTVTVATVQTFADIHVALQQGSAPIYIWDEVSNWWAIDENTGYAINGIHHETTMTIAVAAGRRYYVWLHTLGASYYVADYPTGWSITSSPVGGYEAAYGYAAASLTYNVYFNVTS